LYLLFHSYEAIEYENSQWQAKTILKHYIKVNAGSYTVWMCWYSLRSGFQFLEYGSCSSAAVLRVEWFLRC